MHGLIIVLMGASRQQLHVLCRSLGGAPPGGMAAAPPKGIAAPPTAPGIPGKSLAPPNMPPAPLQRVVGNAIILVDAVADRRGGARGVAFVAAGRRGGAAASPAGRGAIRAAAPRGPDRNLINIQVRHDTVRIELGQRGGGREGATCPVERERDRSSVNTTLGDRRTRSSRAVVRHQRECLAIEEISKGIGRTC